MNELGAVLSMSLVSLSPAMLLYIAASSQPQSLHRNILHNSHHSTLVRCAMALFPAAAIPLVSATDAAAQNQPGVLPPLHQDAAASDSARGNLGGDDFDVVVKAWDGQRLFRREADEPQLSQGQQAQLQPPHQQQQQQQQQQTRPQRPQLFARDSSGGVLAPPQAPDAGVPVPAQPAEVQAALDGVNNVKLDVQQLRDSGGGEKVADEQQTEQKDEPSPQRGEDQEKKETPGVEDPVAAMAHHYGIDDVSKLTPEQRHTLEDRVKFEAEHKGHERQHAQMALILMVGLVLFQFVLLGWKKFHPRSYQLASLLGLWIVPPGIGLSAGNYRYVFAWVCFSAVNLFVVRRALFETPMQSSTPRLVYKWYSYVYNASVAVGFVGYVIVLISFFHLPYALLGFSEKSELSMFQGGVITLFYGLYFGTLGRDFVDRLSDRMAIRTGYFNKSGFPKKHLRPNVCAICGDSTDSGRGHHKSSSSTTAASSRLHKLACDHTYHEECIRGWTIVGKKDCCPYCKEKVDLKAFSRHAWDTTQLLYLNLLDGLRYLIVWNPILFLLMHLLFNFLGYR